VSANRNLLTRFQPHLRVETVGGRQACAQAYLGCIQWSKFKQDLRALIDRLDHAALYGSVRCIAFRKDLRVLGT